MYSKEGEEVVEEPNPTTTRKPGTLHHSLLSGLHSTHRDGDVYTVVLLCAVNRLEWGIECLICCATYKQRVGNALTIFMFVSWRLCCSTRY